MTAVAKSRLGIYGIVALVVIGVTIVSVVALRLYYDILADTPQKAVRAYIDTLNKGDLTKLYDMTRGASSQSQAEFAAMVGSLVRERRLTADAVALEAIGRQGNTYYYRLMAKLRTSDGSYRLLPLILEAGQEGKVWRVGVYLPPAALPPGQ